MKADHTQVTRLLKTARGQIDGILKMIEEDRYCLDVSHQLMATQSILKKANRMVLKAHMDCCVREAVESGEAGGKAGGAGGSAGAAGRLEALPPPSAQRGGSKPDPPRFLLRPVPAQAFQPVRIPDPDFPIPQRQQPLPGKLVQRPADGHPAGRDGGGDLLLGTPDKG